MTETQGPARLLSLAVQHSSAPPSSPKTVEVEHLPNEMLVTIFGFLDAPQICNTISRVCVRWHLVSNDSFLWKDLYVRTFCRPEELDRCCTLPGYDETGTSSIWKHLFVQKVLSIRAWRQGNVKRAKMKGHEQLVRSIAYNPCTRRIYTSSSDHTVRSWEFGSPTARSGNSDGAAETPPQVTPLRVFSGGHYGNVCSVAVHSLRSAVNPDAELVVSGGGTIDKHIVFWDPSTGKMTTTLPDHPIGHTDGVYALQLDDSYLYSASNDRTVKVWDLSVLRPVVTLRGHERGVRCMQVCGHLVVTGSYDYSLRVWDLRVRDSASVIAIHGKYGHSGPIRALRVRGTAAVDRGFHGNFEHIFQVVTGSEDHTARVWDLRKAPASKCADVTRQCLMTTLCGTARGAIFAVWTDDDKILIGGAARELTIFSWDTWRQMRVLNKESHGMCQIWALEAVDQHLFVGGEFSPHGGNSGAFYVYEFSDKVEDYWSRPHTNELLALQGAKGVAECAEGAV